MREQTNMSTAQGDHRTASYGHYELANAYAYMSYFTVQSEVFLATESLRINVVWLLYHLKQDKQSQSHTY
jgi:hypothetical protein